MAELSLGFGVSISLSAAWSFGRELVRSCSSSAERANWRTKAWSVGARFGGAVSMVSSKRAAGGAFFVKHAALRLAGVDEQAKGKRQIVVMIEVANRLRVPVDCEAEVCLGQGLDESALLVADDHRKVDQTSIDREMRRRGRGIVRSFGLLRKNGYVGESE